MRSHNLSDRQQNVLVVAAIILVVVALGLWTRYYINYVDEHQSMGHNICTFQRCFWCKTCSPHEHLTGR